MHSASNLGITEKIKIIKQLDKNSFTTSIKILLLEVLFPRFCFGCNKEGEYLCEDCMSVLEILTYQFCPVCGKRTLDGRTCGNCRRKTALKGLYFAVPYGRPLVKKIINRCKYQTFAKELTSPLAFLIISHFLSLDKKIVFSEFKMAAIPLHQKRLKWRGFNQAEEIAKKLSFFFEVPVLNNALIRIKYTTPQVKMENNLQRKENIKGAFVCPYPEIIKNQKIFLVDDVFTTGATMEEAAKTLKQAGAKEVWGVVTARG